MWIETNLNPVGRKVGDCAVRAVAVALDMGWEAAYIALCINGLQMGDMPSSDSVSTALLRQYGFYRKSIPETFAKTIPKGRMSYILAGTSQLSRTGI